MESSDRFTTASTRAGPSCSKATGSANRDLDFVGQRVRNLFERVSQTGDQTARSLGRFKRERDAEKFVRSLYDAGAITVILPDVYRNKTGDQFADCLLVRLPKSSVMRKAIRQVCARLQRRDLGAMQPGGDFGESHLYFSFG